MKLQLTQDQKNIFLKHLTLASDWYLNNQNSDKQPWGGISDSADKGRFVYEYIIDRNFSRGMGVWGQALAIMSLLDLAPILKNSTDLTSSAMLGANYLKALQVTDFRLPQSIGAFREHTPMTEESYPRDGVTGAFGLCRLFQETQDDIWLQHARMFADWWINFGTDNDNWPYITFNIDKQYGHNFGMEVVGEAGADLEMVKGDWQAGACIFFYQLYKLTGNEEYIEKAFTPMITRLADIYKENQDKPIVEGFHGEVPISYGNDDFAFISLVCDYQLHKDKKTLELLTHRINAQNSLMTENGAYPSFGGTFASGINNLEFLKLVETEKLDIDTSATEKCIHKIAEFGLTLQEKETNDKRLLGGLYGQSNYGISRNCIHHRSTAYSINFYLKLLNNKTISSLSSFGW